METRLLKPALVAAILMTMLVPSFPVHGQICQPGQEQQCFCSDSSTSTQTCRPDGNGWNKCQCTNTYSIYCDPATNLCWQDPQKDAYITSDIGVTQPDAIRYCQELALGGYNDWRLPDIAELRTIVRGDPGTVTGGDCPITESVPKLTMNDPGCMPITEYAGPGAGGCYWEPALTGACNKPDPAAAGHSLETCSSTVSSDDPNWIADVMFDNGAVPFNHILSYADVRCARNAPSPAVKCAESPAGPCTPGATIQCNAPSAPGELTPTNLGSQTCTDDGSCWGPCESTGFTPSPPVVDVCPTCDQIHLTIKVPQPLTYAPAQLMAFLYSAEGFSWPLKRPPDGGTSDDQVMNPVFVNNSYQLLVPGCSYYRTKCLSGDYYLYIALLQSGEIPPVMQEGDYWWGMPSVQPLPLTLGTGEQRDINLEITLVPYEATVIKLASFTATAKAWSVVLNWKTESETDNAGFNIYRAESENGQYTKINKALIHAQGCATQGAKYVFTDNKVKNRTTYSYKLEDIDLNGKPTMHGPVSAMPKWILGILGKY
jgi:hypothetical protein